MAGLDKDSEVQVVRAASRGKTGPVDRAVEASVRAVSAREEVVVRVAVSAVAALAEVVVGLEGVAADKDLEAIGAARTTDATPALEIDAVRNSR